MAAMSGTKPEARLLVVEDDPNIPELLSASLRLAGFEVASATGGLEAINATQRHRPDLVVLDVMLPDLDGFEVARRLRKAQILDYVWNYDFRGDSSIVESYVSYLRRKVDAVEPRLIHTIRSVGYVLRLPDP
jgi:DNA-binding response OmpR family regulator